MNTLPCNGKYYRKRWKKGYDLMGGGGGLRRDPELLEYCIYDMAKNASDEEIKLLEPTMVSKSCDVKNCPLNRIE